MNNPGKYLFILPGAILLTLFVFFPALQILANSFTDRNYFTPAVFVGVANYSNLLQDEKFWLTLLNSFLFISVTPILILISLSLALLLREENKVNRGFRLFFFLPVITPVVVAGIIWKWMLNSDTGIVNYLLQVLGLPQINWLSSYPENMFSVMLLTIWRGAGYYMMIFLAGLALVDKELEEAAFLDGATLLQRVIHILVPQIRPTIILVFVISSVAAFKMFTELYILIPGAPLQHKTLVSFLFRESFEKFNFGYGSAAGVVLFLCTFGFSYANIKLMERGNDR